MFDWVQSLIDAVSAWGSGVAEDFYNNLIYANRYKMLFSGLWVTIQVALLSVFFGVLLGCVIALMRLSKSRFLRGLSTIYVDVIRGTPMLVQLLIIYYVILASYHGPQLVVAVLAFSLNSAAYVSEIVRGGILAIDKGQTEAGRSLGLSSGATLLLIVMPQAIKVILPSLFNEFIMLIKETSIVGFIGMEDLTKKGDFIRSRTFSAFFPLLAVALIYLTIVTVLSRVFARVERRLRQGDLR